MCGYSDLSGKFRGVIVLKFSFWHGVLGGGCIYANFVVIVSSALGVISLRSFVFTPLQIVGGRPWFPSPFTAIPWVFWRGLDYPFFRLHVGQPDKKECSNTMGLC